MKKYLVVLTVDFEQRSFYVYANAETEEKAAEYGRNVLENEHPIYRGLSHVYRVFVQ
ncbi:MAG: hypothetical protein RRY99_10700 [Flavobacterium sp.]